MPENHFRAKTDEKKKHQEAKSTKAEIFQIIKDPNKIYRMKKMTEIVFLNDVIMKHRQS